MLDIYIIEQIRKRQEDQQRIYERPALRLPLPLEPAPRREEAPSVEPEPARVIIIDL
ncbi:hypothetical protein KKF91_10130 [Myxococcota bacterium]|nr:hypothetical protein [Myxococcota bacterium]MBU1430891.1 hypothetical protein [Myxococcota bacterium]MBU1899198.1 hypothetical protein [Myxococcota bacterium]